MLESGRIQIHHDGWEYFKKDDQWKRYSKFLGKQFDLNEDEVPPEVQNGLNRKVKKAARRETKASKQAQIAKDVRFHARKQKKQMIRPSSNSAFLLSEREGTSQQRKIVAMGEIGDSEKETMEATEDGTEPIVITTSQQLIRPLRAQLKATDPGMAEEFNKRLMIQQKGITMNTNMETEGATPFEPREKMSMELFLRRNKKHSELALKTNQMVSKLETLKAQHKMLEMAEQGEDEFDPIVRLPEVRNCFKIEDLQHFADARGLSVLNLDQFICSTDRREPIYNSKGQCIFCIVHNVFSTIRHQNPNNCAFRFCNCTNCYFVSSLHQAGILGSD